MASPEGSTWVFDCPLMDDLAAAGFDAAPTGGFYWTPAPPEPLQPPPLLQPVAAAAAAPNAWY
ncbi:hypothetical protein ABZP36_001634 [Zizania latifolia]